VLVCILYYIHTVVVFNPMVSFRPLSFIGGGRETPSRSQIGLQNRWNSTVSWTLWITSCVAATVNTTSTARLFSSQPSCVLNELPSSRPDVPGKFTLQYLFVYVTSSNTYWNFGANSQRKTYPEDGWEYYVTRLNLTCPI